jgi:hypothetical protein
MKDLPAQVKKVITEKWLKQDGPPRGSNQHRACCHFLSYIEIDGTQQFQFVQFFFVFHLASFFCFLD